MPEINLFTPLTFKHGTVMKNRFMLAPLTNLQSYKDGCLSDDEFHWLTMRAKGGFGLTMSCAAYVNRLGQGFKGQLGIFSSIHLEGLSRLATGIKAQGSLAVVQLHHAGMRSPESLIGQAPLCPSDNAEFGARAMSETEVVQLIEDFITAAERAERAGFDGVEIHGAHGYILSQFLSTEINRRADRYGGSLGNRARPIREIIAGIRKRCRPNFNLGLRLSPERFGLKFTEIIELTRQIIGTEEIDYLDMSLWDVAKEPEDAEFKGRRLISYFTELNRGNVLLGVAGKIMSAQTARECIEAGADFVLIGRGAILHHDFPRLVQADPAFLPIRLPVTRQHLHNEGLGPRFIDYMTTWKGFVADS